MATSQRSRIQTASDISVVADWIIQGWRYETESKVSPQDTWKVRKVMGHLGEVNLSPSF